MIRRLRSAFGLIPTWPLAAALVAAVAACFDDSIPSSFSGANDAGRDADDASSGDDGSSCPILTPTLTVDVVDAVNGADVCDATVVASSSAASLTLTKQGTPATCAYSAGFPAPPPGTYTVTVTAPNYLPATQSGIVITQDACGTEAPTVEVRLQVPHADAGGH
jgi:hypothetical protein